jgi:myo-inositol 2-dehydrogenase/D-chiro-inositol 1-dehydrogenase
MTTTPELRVGVVGAGQMGADHIKRLTGRVSGARVSAIVEPDAARAAAAQQLAPGSAAFASLEDAIAADALDAVVIATPGRFHEPVLLPAIEAGLPTLCEKPLTEDAESSWRVLEAEMAGGKKVLQVGFMRRFDPQYARLREFVAGKEAGELLMLRCVHRNPSVLDYYTQEMLIADSVVHEFDVVPWLVGSSIHSVQVRRGRRNSLSPAHLDEPILVLIELDNGVLADVEMNVSVQFGYQVATEAVFEKGIARIGQPAGMQVWQDGTFRIEEHRSFVTRFAEAYDIEVQAWVDAAGHGTIAGPSAWDAYRVSVAVEAGLQALREPGPVELALPAQPDFYA